MIYGGTRGHVFAIYPTTGEEKWRTKLQSGGLFNAASDEDVMVLIKDGVVIASSNGHMWGLHIEDGEILWHNGLKGLGHDVISLATDGIAIQYVHKHTKSS